jgi:NitT/TauT family transport system permease protein
VVLCLAWQLYATWLNNNLLFPTLGETLEALYDSLVNGPLVQRTLTSLQILLTGYAAGLAIAGIFTTLAITTRVGTDFLSTLTAMFNPLPAIALLPLALLWFGLGAKSLVFVIIHSVLWAVALNTHSGFTSVSPTLRMAGQNCGLKGISFVMLLLVPAAFPSILTGLKIGWAFAWRTLIAAELVFGVSSGQGGLGWYIFESKNQLNIPEVFAGLLTIILIGLAVENVVFRFIETRTVQRWGMQT